jgi:transposase
MFDRSAFEKSLSGLRGDPDALVGIILEQAEAIVSLRAEVEALRRELEAERSRHDDLQRQLQEANDQIAALRKQLEEAERAAQRQAAPFRIPDKRRKKEHKPPGRPPGHPGLYRSRPERIDAVVEVPLEVCPDCGGRLEGVRAVEQFIEEIPPLRPHVTRLVTYEGQCGRCGKVRSTHPLQVSTARGAAGTHLGPRALGVALELMQRHGLTKRKTSAVLAELFGLRVSPGGLVQAAHRLAGKLQDSYQALRRAVREAPAIYADETSWWVGGPKWWLWVFADPTRTLYRVEPQRGRAVVHETLGPDFPGVLVSDCLVVYDGATPRQHKCYAHHLKAIGEAMAQHPRGGEGFLRDVRHLLLAAQALKAAKPTLSESDYLQRRHTLESQAQHLLAPKRGDPLEETIAQRLRKQQDHLFTFLDDDAVEATNNLAERQLRPAVIARKVSCGNRTERGARTWEILASLAATCLQQGTSFRDLVAHTARLRSPQTAR